MKPLEDKIHRLLPNITDKPTFNQTVKGLGDLAIVNIAVDSANQYNYFRKVTSTIIKLLQQQAKDFPLKAYVNKLKPKKKSERTRKRHKHCLPLNYLQSYLVCCGISKEESCFSNWLTALPITEYGFFLHKGDFKDAICLSYGWHPAQLPTNCICNKKFTLNHA